MREAKGEHSAQLIDHLKKTEMAKEAERLLNGTGWLPEPLRLAASEPAVTEPACEAEALPDFLAGDVDDAGTPDYQTSLSRTPSRQNSAYQRGGFGRFAPMPVAQRFGKRSRKRTLKISSVCLMSVGRRGK